MTIGNIHGRMRMKNGVGKGIDSGGRGMLGFLHQPNLGAVDADLYSSCQITTSSIRAKHD